MTQEDLRKMREDHKWQANEKAPNSAKSCSLETELNFKLRQERHKNWNYDGRKL